jgi:hypothetical protein
VRWNRVSRSPLGLSVVAEAVRAFSGADARAGHDRVVGLPELLLVGRRGGF